MVTAAEPDPKLGSSNVARSNIPSVTGWLAKTALVENMELKLKEE